ncbi:MAG: aminotransferase class I/II-fold pyridoxal phosphate-dependent enzyme [Eubacteriales bacterium]|nr:aminotransferase class I/II-fold pyridoxal phosphate-dependent enzyme [Eubacteriales bacterium]
MIDFLLKHADLDPVSWHMPGHKGSEIFRRYGYEKFMERFVDCDVTEIPGADNLFQAEGIIRDVQDRYARLYDVDYSYLMINGTSGGILAAMMASVPSGGKIIMARNCHKSVFNGLVLGGIQPVYAYPSVLNDCDISGPILPEEIGRLLEENPDAGAVILPSPNYYGICSDIRAIADIVHEHGKVLIVDQAHGAHLKFFHKFGWGEDLPNSAEMDGADITICSIHKTLASLTQSAVLNLQGSRVDRYVLEDKLQAVESTSPSYILMSFLDINARILEEHGSDALGEWKENLAYFYAKTKQIKGLHILNLGSQMDHTKINLDMSAYGINGGQLEELLMEYGIFSELYTGNILMLMTGIGNTREHYDRTLDALKHIAEKHEYIGSKTDISDQGLSSSEGNKNRTGNGPMEAVAGKLHPIPQRRRFVDLTGAEGMICAGSIIPYPPGIPIVCPGEEITAEVIHRCKALREKGEKVIGINDHGQVQVGL